MTGSAVSQEGGTSASCDMTRRAVQAGGGGRGRLVLASRAGDTPNRGTELETSIIRITIRVEGKAAAGAWQCHGCREYRATSDIR